jgi:O-antigen/teichoic acid export membrane protein
MEGRQYWIKSGILTLLEKGSGLVFAVGSAAILFRSLSKEDFAAWGIFLLITYFLEMGRSGLIQNGLLRHLTLNRENPSDYAAISTASFTINLFFSVCSNIVLWLAADWLIVFYHAPQIASVLPVYFITNFIMAFFYHCNFVQQANLEFRGIFWGTFFFRGALFAWILCCKLSGMAIQLQPLAISMLIGASVGSLASWLYARPFLHFTKTLDFQWVGKLVSYGKYVLGTNLSTMFYKSIDKLTLGHLAGPAAFAVYDAAAKVTQLIETPSFTMAAIVFPQSARRMERDGPAGIAYLYERSVGAILAIILPFLAGTLLFAEPVIWVFAGPKYMESANILRLTAFFGLFLPFAVQSGTILDSIGRPALNFVCTFFTAALNLGLSYLFVREFGMFGAALATLTGYAVSFIILQRILYRQYGIRWWRAFSHIAGFYRMGYHMIQSKLGFTTKTPQMASVVSESITHEP